LLPIIGGTEGARELVVDVVLLVAVLLDTTAVIVVLDVEVRPELVVEDEVEAAAEEATVPSVELNDELLAAGVLLAVDVDADSEVDAEELPTSTAGPLPLPADIATDEDEDEGEDDELATNLPPQIPFALSACPNVDFR
jgi:hypothetical protein